MPQVVVAKETLRNLGGLVSQLSLDIFENEGRRAVPTKKVTVRTTKGNCY